MKHTKQGNAVSVSALEEETVKAVLKTNYYRLIPAAQAQTETLKDGRNAVGDVG